MPIFTPVARPSSLTWAGDHILFTMPDGVKRVSADGGTPETIVSSGPDEIIRRVQLLPDGDTLLFTSWPSNDAPDRWTNTQIVAWSLTSKARKVLVKGASDGWYVASGHLVYMIGGALYAVRFDVSRLEPAGAAVQIVDGVETRQPDVRRHRLVQRLTFGHAGVHGAGGAGHERVSISSSLIATTP